MLTGREKEIKELMEKYNSLESSFVAIYGRRRIGKTYLINELFNESIIFRYAGIYNGKKIEQLYAFSESLKEYGLKLEEDLNDWFKAFSCLKNFMVTKKSHKILFLV